MDEKQKKREELKRKYKKDKCTKCIWGNKENKFCMFPKCFEELDERRNKE